MQESRVNLALKEGIYIDNFSLQALRHLYRVLEDNHRRSFIVEEIVKSLVSIRAIEDICKGNRYSGWEGREAR